MDTLHNAIAVSAPIRVSPSAGKASPERSTRTNAGEWIDFKELCRRIPNKSEATLRRYVADRLITSRQLGGKRGRREFNWKTVERELQVLESRGVHADAADKLTETAEQFAKGGVLAADLVAIIGQLRDEVQELKRRVSMFVDQQSA